MDDFWFQMGPGALLRDSKQVYLDVGWVGLVWKWNHLEKVLHLDLHLLQQLLDAPVTSGRFQIIRII